jgi:hypothetical protein
LESKPIGKQSLLVRNFEENLIGDGYTLIDSPKTKEKRIDMKSKRTRKSTSAEPGLLMNVARTIGSTLGTLAARTTKPTKALPRAVRGGRSKSKGSKARSKHNA